MDLPDQTDNTEEKSEAEQIAELRQQLLLESEKCSSKNLIILKMILEKSTLVEKVAELNSEKGYLGHKIGSLRKENITANDLLKQNTAMIAGLQTKITALNKELSPAKSELSHVQNDKNVSNILKDLIKHDVRVANADNTIRQLKKELLEQKQTHETAMWEERNRFNKETGRLGRIIGNLRNGFDSSD